MRIHHVVVIGTLVMVGLTTGAEAAWKWTPQTGRFINEGRLPKETAELQVEHARSLMLESRYDAAWTETEKFKDFYGNSEFADQNQFLRGEIRFKQGRYLDAAKQFQQVIAKFPDSSLYDEVIRKQYECGDALYNLGQKRLDQRWRLFRKKPLKNAIEVYRMVIDNQPFTDAAAEAQYKVGLCYAARKDYTEAGYEYKRVMEDYSASEWVDEAAYGLAICYYEDSHSPEYDQGPSLRAIEAMDDFKTRFPADARNEELTAKRATMRERVAAQRLQTARFYEKRRTFTSARVYYDVVVKQFPETKAAETARAWLDKNMTVGLGTPSKDALFGAPTR